MSTRMRFTDKVVVVTGAAQGIGEAYARALAAEGASVVVADIDVGAARASRRKFDVAGHYARPDVFTLHVNRTRQSPISFD